MATISAIMSTILLPVGVVLVAMAIFGGGRNGRRGKRR